MHETLFCQNNLRSFQNLFVFVLPPVESNLAVESESSLGVHLDLANRALARRHGTQTVKAPLVSMEVKDSFLYLLCPYSLVPSHPSNLIVSSPYPLKHS